MTIPVSRSPPSSARAAAASSPPIAIARPEPPAAKDEAVSEFAAELRWRDYCFAMRAGLPYVQDDAPAKARRRTRSPRTVAFDIAVTDLESESLPFALDD